MTNVIGYVRASTEEQAITIEAQKEKLRAWGVLNECAVEVVVDAGESGKDMERPGLKKILQKIRDGGVGCLVATKLDRLTRSTKDLWVLVDLLNAADVKLVSIAEQLDTRSPTGRMVLTIMSGVAQWEREVIVERTTEALAQLKREGKRTGTVPYGKRVEGGRLICDEGEQKVLAHITRLRDMGETFRGIADELNRLGMVTRAGGEWKHQYIANLLKEGR